LCIYSYLGCKKNLGPPEHKIKINFDLSLKVYNAALTMLKKKKLGQFSLGKKIFFLLFCHGLHKRNKELLLILFIISLVNLANHLFKK